MKMINSMLLITLSHPNFNLYPEYNIKNNLLIINRKKLKINKDDLQEIKERKKKWLITSLFCLIQTSCN
jgi:hypothetical protein